MPNLIERRPTVVISRLSPHVECGRYPAKRVVGERLIVEADIFKDGHDVLVAMLHYRLLGEEAWFSLPMEHLGNDRWVASMEFEDPGRLEFKIQAWADDFLTWLHEFERRLTGDQEDFSTEIEEGRVILNRAAIRAASAKQSKDADRIEALTTRLMRTKAQEVPELLNTPEHLELMARWPDTSLATESTDTLEVLVEEKLSSFSAWYEFFPRSAEGIAGKHSKLRDCMPRIQYAKDLGFDIVYFPPIHPVGETYRKGKNNSLKCEPDDVGSPWAIGGLVGGHRAVEPALGTIDDFIWLVAEARKIGIEIAMDFAINCSPDHPYVRNHPEWFFHRPDGSIKYAENPPKKYQDIYPINFHCDEWKDLWEELLDVVQFWVDRGVRVFRVDNPHTKPVPFWEWLIASIQEEHPEVIFLAEAFTKPKMMQTLAKAGFTQGYTYFTWRVTKHELTEYVTELTKGEMKDYFRANFWPNTPDILPFHLQNAPPAAFKLRAALAATMTTSWGMYSGYEFCENKPLTGREEYLDSEKYQLYPRNWDAPGNIKEFIRKLNEIRKSEEAFQFYQNIEFVPADNDHIISYWRWSEDKSSIVLIVVNLDPQHEQQSYIHLPLESMGLVPGEAFNVTDLMYGDSYTWRESTNFVLLDPRSKPVHVLKIK